jgi:valyl-tRNA synthetase
MEIAKNFNHQQADASWYHYWIEKGYFNSTPNPQPAYTIVIPPPNVTGVLHMGHCLNNTIQDILIRRARMQGFNACWVPGTDHASIATEAKVVQMLRGKGIAKSSLSRDKFLEHAWEWKEKYGGIILQQLKKLGCSLDWNRTSFTMDNDYYASVVNVFIDLHNKGLIYRGKRMVNWDPVGLTALSDEEVIFKEIDAKLYHVSYLLANGNGKITVATTRPETILGDVAICVHPTDHRYQHLIGQQVIVPIINRSIPVIADEYVSADFGTGALKITPAHDKNDQMLGIKHQLKAIDTLDETGKFTIVEIDPAELTPQIQSYIGQDRFELRKKIATDIDALGQLEKIEDYKGQVGTSERTGAVIENKLSLQWFVNMKAFIERNPKVIEDVLNDTITFHPAKLKNTYKYWLDNIKDWCISRQLWWGQRIPAWYDDAGNYVVASTAEEAKEVYLQKYQQPATTLKQDEDVLDTWFSSWLWPMEVFKGISNPGNKDANYYYPSTTLVTGQDIIFFWVARMIMAGYEYTGTPPFKNVYFTGMVRDKQGRKMSKQLGNSPDLLGLIDQYGADAVRFGILIASPAGNDLLWDESSNEQGRNFCNKLWNAMKLVKMWEQKQDPTTNTPEADFAQIWFQNRLNQATIEVESLMQQFRLSEALKTIYSLIWDDFCSWYLEWVKPGFEQPIASSTYQQTTAFFNGLLQLLHPFMPFITEEIYHTLQTPNNDLCNNQLHTPIAPNLELLQQGQLLKNIITALREARAKNQLKPKDPIQLHIQTANSNHYAHISSILAKQVNASGIAFTNQAVANSIVVAIESDKFFIESEQNIDSESLKQQLLKDLEYQQGFLQSVQKKLQNERFVQNAKPEVVEVERKKMADAATRIKTIQESLIALEA